MTHSVRQDRHRMLAQDFAHRHISWVPCGTCETPTPNTGTKRCDPCFEIETGLNAYLDEGGQKALEFVRSALNRVRIG